MAAFGLPVIATLALWWASTGVILYLDGRPPRTFSWSLAGRDASARARAGRARRVRAR